MKMFFLSGKTNYKLFFIKLQFPSTKFASNFALRNLRKLQLIFLNSVLVILPINYLVCIRNTDQFMLKIGQLEGS